MPVFRGERKGNYLDTQVWDSLINWGDSTLLTTELQDDLFDIYAIVQSQNIETSRARDAAEAYRREPNMATIKAHSDFSTRIGIG